MRASRLIQVGVFVLSLCSICSNSFADTLNTCHLEGKIQLQSPTVISCNKDLTFAPSTVIITQGFPLSILAFGSIHFGNDRTTGTEIRSFEENSHTPHRDAARVYIFAQTAYGFLKVSNLGATASDAGGETAVEFTTLVPGFDQVFETDAFARKSFILNGDSVN